MGPIQDPMANFGREKGGGGGAPIGPNGECLGGQLFNGLLTRVRGWDCGGLGGGGGGSGEKSVLNRDSIEGGEVGWVENDETRGKDQSWEKTVWGGKNQGWELAFPSKD